MSYCQSCGVVEGSYGIFVCDECREADEIVAQRIEIKRLREAIAVRLVRGQRKDPAGEYRVGYNTLLDDGYEVEIERLCSRIKDLDMPHRTEQGGRAVLQCPQCLALWYEDGDDLQPCDDDCPTKTNPLEPR